MNARSARWQAPKRKEVSDCDEGWSRRDGVAPSKRGDSGLGTFGNEESDGRP